MNPQILNPEFAFDLLGARMILYHRSVLFCPDDVGVETAARMKIRLMK